VIGDFYGPYLIDNCKPSKLPQYIPNLILVIDNIESYEEHVELHPDNRVTIFSCEERHDIKFDKLFMIGTKGVTKMDILLANQKYDEPAVIVCNEESDWDSAIEFMKNNMCNKPWYRKLWDMIPEYEALV